MPVDGGLFQTVSARRIVRESRCREFPDRTGIVGAAGSAVASTTIDTAAPAHRSHAAARRASIGCSAHVGLATNLAVPTRTARTVFVAGGGPAGQSPHERSRD